jgi:hypothetical protein
VQLVTLHANALIYQALLQVSKQESLSYKPWKHPTVMLGLAWLGLAWLGLAWLGLAWLGLAWLGLAWPGHKQSYGVTGAGPKRELKASSW